MYHMAIIYAICVIFLYLSFIPQELRNPVACDNPPIRGPASSAATWRFLARDLSNVHICSSSFQTYPEALEGESSFQLHKKNVLRVVTRELCVCFRTKEYIL